MLTNTDHYAVADSATASTYPPPPASRADAIASIRRDLRRRTGRAWSVTGGTGTAYGWLTIDAPPRLRTWERFETGEHDERGWPVIGWRNAGPGLGYYSSPEDCKTLCYALNIPLELAGAQGVSIPPGARAEYADRAAGRVPREIFRPDWD